MNAGAIAGGAVGGVVVLGALVVIAWYMLRRRRQTNTRSTVGASNQGPDDDLRYTAPKERINEEYGQETQFQPVGESTDPYSLSSGRLGGRNY